MRGELKIGRTLKKYLEFITSSNFKILWALIMSTFLLFPGKTNAQKNDLTAFTTDSLLGKSTPQFAGLSLSGFHWDNDQIRGKVVLLNFWFIGCPPCMREIKYFNELHREYQKDDFVMLSIAPQVKEDLLLFNDTVKTSVSATLRGYFEADPLEYEVIPTCETRRHDDPNKVGVECDHITKDFFISGYPTTVIIDKSGIIRHVQTGFTNTEEGGLTVMDKYREVIDQLLVE